MDEDMRLKARELLLRSRLYRFIAVVFALFGIILFWLLYTRYVEGDIAQALSRPGTVLLIVLPFLPASVLSWMAVRSEKKLAALLENLHAADDKKQG